MDNPSFLEPVVDHSDDEDGYPWDCDRGGDLGNYEED
jgi:hypothetical protein